MLGVYESFPENIQGIAFFASAVSRKRLQQVLIEVFGKLNNETLHLEDFANPSIPKCKVMLELGIAEAQNFNYLDDEEINRVAEEIDRKPLHILDFLCVLRYYRTQNDKERPLRFDYYMLRFVFDKRSIEMRVFHERGSMHISPEEMVEFVGNRINTAFSKRVLRIVEAS